MKKKIKFDLDSKPRDVLIPFTGDPISLASLIIAGISLAWGIYRDLKKDRNERRKKDKRKRN